MGKAIRLLLIEDDDQVRPLLEYVLSDHGYVVEAVATAADARSHLGRTTYDLVIADARLPDGSGIDVVDEAKAKGMKVAILTGFAAQSPKSRAQHDYLFKPIRPDDFIRAVTNYVGSPRRP